MVAAEGGSCRSPVLISDRASRAVVTRWLFSSRVFLFCFHYRKWAHIWASAWGRGSVFPHPRPSASLLDAHPPAPVSSAIPCGSQLWSSHLQGGSKCPPRRAEGWELATHSWASLHHCWWPGGERARIKEAVPQQVWQALLRGGGSPARKSCTPCPRLAALPCPPSH